MTKPASTLRRVARRARATTASSRTRLQELLPPRLTILRVPADRNPPPSAFARFGESSWVVPPASVTRPERVAIGDGVVVMEHSTLEVLDDEHGTAPAALTLGDGVILARFNTFVCGIGIAIGDRVASSDSATVFDTWWPGAPVGPFPNDRAPVVIGRHAYLGCNSIVGPGVTVGEGAFVGEGAVVVADVPAHSVVYGNPARVVRRYEERTRCWLDVDGLAE
jgi:acetyltransferase-like isoleucine patch superfamily enzyme